MRKDLLARPRLLELLDRGTDHNLTLVSTPPGYGKTTILCQWLASTDHPACWVSLDGLDNDSAVFFVYVVAAIQSIDREICAETWRLVTEEKSVPVRVIISSLINDLEAATKPFVLVLDDFHAISSPEITDGIAALLTNMPTMLRLLITTRADPPLPLLRMRARGEILELRATDIGFDAMETLQLFKVRHGLDLTPTEIDTLLTWSEGWPVGLMLVGQALQNRPNQEIGEVIDQLTGSGQFVEDYLWAEAVEHLPPELRGFLLQTAILERFNAEACAAVTGSKDAEATLRALEDENAFLIALEGQERWYRFHHLFANALRYQLAQESTEASLHELHRRAARWFADGGFVEDAARHAIAGRDWGLATTLLVPICRSLYRQERTRALREWLEPLPTDVLEREPDLSYWLAWGLVRLGRTREAMQPLKMAEHGWSACGNDAGIGKVLLVRMMQDVYSQRIESGLERGKRALSLIPASEHDDRARIHILSGLLHMMQGDVPNSEEAFLQGRALIQESGPRSLRLNEMNGSGGILMMQGKLHEPAALFRRVIAIGDEWNDLPVQYAHWLLASIHIEWNQLEHAVMLLDRGIELAEQMSAPLHRVRIHQLRAEIAWARGDEDTAYSEVEQAIDANGMTDRLTESRLARALLARFWMSSNQLALAHNWARETRLDAASPPEHPRLQEYLTFLRLMSLEGHNDRVVHLLGPLEKRAEQSICFHDLLNMLLLRSVAEYELGNPEASIAALDRALRIGVPEGFVRTFLNMGDRIVQPLELAARQPGEQFQYARLLIDAFGSDTTRVDAVKVSSFSPLSVRETEVLNLVASGSSNADVAETLFISEQTVKKHLSNLYEKLEVASRTQAVDRARRFGFI